MAESRGKNKNLVEAGNPRLLKKLVKNDTEYSLYLEYQMGYNRDNARPFARRKVCRCIFWHLPVHPSNDSKTRRRWN